MIPTILLSLVISTIILFILSFFIDDSRSKGIFGENAKVEPTKILKRRHKGLQLGHSKRLSTDDSLGHALIVGASGSNKTQNLLLFNCIHLSKYHSLLINDPKLELYTTTAHILRDKLNCDVHLLNFFNSSKSSLFNPFSQLNEKTDSDAFGFATTIYDLLNPDDTEAIWKYSAIEILAIIIFCLLQKRTYATFQNIHLMLLLCQARDPRAQQLIDLLAPNEKTKLIYKRIVSLSDKLFASIISTALASIIPFTSQIIADITSGNTLPSVQDMRDKRTVVFLSIPVGQEAIFAPIASLYLSMLSKDIMANSVSDGNKIFFLLEEFGTLLRIPSYEFFVPTARGFNCSLIHVIQDTEQLQRTYGSSADTIINNCASIIVLPGLKSVKTLELLDKIIGKITTPYFDMVNEQLKSNTRSLFDSATIRRLKDNSALLLFRNRNPSLIYLKPFYKQSFIKLWFFGLYNYKRKLRPIKPLFFPEYSLKKAPIITDLFTSSSTNQDEDETKSKDRNELLNEIRNIIHSP